MIPLILFVSAARATPASVDIELVSPAFEARSVPGADAAFSGVSGSFRGGTLLMYEYDPLVYRTGGADAGAAVADRFTTDLGLSWDLSPELALHAYFPAALQWGADSVEAANGIGAGDIDVGGHLAVFHGDTVGLALRGDVRFPSSTPNMFLGERAVRGSAGPDLSLGIGPVDVIAGAAVEGRQAVDTFDDLVVGTEISGDAAVNLHVIPDRLALHVAAVGRGQIAKSASAGATPFEAMLGAQVWPAKWLQVDLGVGHGLTSGYGSTGFRAFLGLTFVYNPQPRAAEDVTEVDVAPPPPPYTEPIPCMAAPTPPPPPPVEPPPAAPAWNAGELAKVVKDRIVIRDPIQFDLGTANILPGSQPVLQAVARTLKDHPEILQVVIEGHASDEGPYDANYELSMQRAATIYKLLVEAGIDAQRLSIRALGKVVPKSSNPAENRRVEFHITDQADADDTAVAPTHTPVPWTGEKVKP